VRGVHLSVEKETDAGLVVSGAKVVATGAVLTNDNFIGSFAPIPPGGKEFAAAFLVRTGTAAYGWRSPATTRSSGWRTLRWARESGQTRRYEQFVERCLAEYDTTGWTDPPLYGSEC